ISPRYLSQDDRIEIADGLRRGESGRRNCRPHRQELSNRVPGDCAEPKAQRLLRSLVRAQPGVPATATPQAAAICARRRPAHGGRRQADPPLVTGPDQSVAPPPLPAPCPLACLHRDDLRGGLSGPDRARGLDKLTYRPYLKPGWRAGAPGLGG